MSNRELKTPLSWLYHWEKERPNALFLSQPIDGKSITMTWKEAGQEVRKLAAALKAKNLPPQSKIALVSKNCCYWVLCDLAIMMAGHVSVPLYPNINDNMLFYVLNHSEAEILFVGKLDDWASMAEGVPEHVSCISFPNYGPKEFEQWSDLCNEHEALEGEPNRDLEEMMTIIYTSGTTGRPKGVVHKFGSLAYAIEGAKTQIDVGGVEGRLFSYLPLSHIAERMLVEMGAIYMGTSIYFAESLDTFAQNLKDAKPTVFMAVPRIWTKFQMGILEKMPQKRLNTLLKIPFISGVIKRKIREGLGLNEALHCLTGAAPTPPNLIRWYNKLGINLQEVYGMTENAAYSHYNRVDNVKIGSAGQAMPGVEVRISEEGEILMKCDALMTEYYKEDEMTANVFTDGFFHTGDQGKVDENGFLFITGRVKDIFKTAKGKYVVPSPIEMKISKNQNVEQICVSGTTVPQPIALIVLSEEARSKSFEDVAESLQNTIQEINPGLEKHERIKKAVIVNDEWTIENEILTPTMKIKRSNVDKKYGDRYEAWYEKDALVLKE